MTQRQPRLSTGNSLLWSRVGIGADLAIASTISPNCPLSVFLVGARFVVLRSPPTFALLRIVKGMRTVGIISVLLRAYSWAGGLMLHVVFIALEGNDNARKRRDTGFMLCWLYPKDYPTGFSPVLPSGGSSYFLQTFRTAARCPVLMRRNTPRDTKVCKARRKRACAPVCHRGEGSRTARVGLSCIPISLFVCPHIKCCRRFRSESERPER